MLGKNTNIRKKIVITFILTLFLMIMWSTVAYGICTQCGQNQDHERCTDRKTTWVDKGTSGHIDVIKCCDGNTIFKGDGGTPSAHSYSYEFATSYTDGQCFRSHCSVCGRNTSWSGHDMVLSSGTEATCTTGGSATYTCTRVASHTYSSNTPALGHNYVTTEATCTSGGEERCTRCGDVRSSTPALGHNWSGWTTDIYPTCTSTGSKHRSCYRCGKEEESSISMSPHDYESFWRSDGSGHWHKCKNCNATTDYGTHTGGTATCTDQKYCSTCNAGYGDIAPNNHDWNPWIDLGVTVGHRRVCKRASTHVEEGAHSDLDSNGKCDVCNATLDNTAPTVGGAYADGLYLGGTYYYGPLVRSGKVTFTEVKDDITGVGKVEVLVNGVYSGLASGSGTTYTYDVPFSGEGIYTVTAKVTDNASNSMTWSSLTLAVDATAPNAGTVTMTKASGGAYSSGTWTNESVTITVQDGSDKGTIMSGHESTTFSVDGVGSYKSTTLTTQGTYTITVTTTDKVGNSSINTYTVKIDKTAPTAGTVTMTKASGGAYSSGTWTNESVTITVQDGSDNGAASVNSGHASTTFSINGVGANTSTTLTAQGTYTITVTTTDVAGNKDTRDYTVLIDKTAPITGVLTMTNTTSNTTYTENTWTKESVRLVVADGSDQSVAGATSGHANTQITVTGTESKGPGKDITLTTEGTYTVKVTTTDIAGNSSSYERTVLIDKTAPNAGTLTMTKQSGTTYESNKWTNESVTIKLNQGSDVSKTNATSGHQDTSYSVTGPDSYTNIKNDVTLTKEGTYNLTVTTVDVAGNVSTNSYVVLIDKTAPILGVLTMRTPGETGGEYKSDTWVPTDVWISLADGSDTQKPNATSGHASTTYEVKNGMTVAATTGTRTFSSDGIYEIKVRTRDVAGNETTADYVVKVDKTNPIVGTVDLTNVDLNGNTSAYQVETWTNKDVKITLHDGSDPVINRAASGHKETTYALVGPINVTGRREELTLTDNGTYTITVTTKDMVDHTVTSQYIVKIDKTLPEPGLVTLKEGSINEEDYTPGEWTNKKVHVGITDGYDELSGLKGTTYTVTDENGNVIASGNAPITDQEIGTSGKGKLTVTTEDQAGNKVERTYELWIDLTNPSITSSNITYGSDEVIIITDTHSGTRYWGVTTSETEPSVTGNVTTSKSNTLNQWNPIDATLNTTVTFTNLNVGTYYVWAKDLSGNVSHTSFKVTPRSLNVEWANTQFYFNFKEHMPTATVQTGVAGESMTLKVVSPKVNVGTYTATASIETVTGGNASKDNYTLANPTQQFKILPNPNMKWNIELEEDEYEWDGTPKEPKVKVTVEVDGEVHELEEGKDFDVKYENNTEPGTGKVVVTGKGDPGGNPTPGGNGESGGNFGGQPTPPNNEKTFTIEKASTRNLKVLMENYTYGEGTLPQPRLNENVEIDGATFYYNTIESNQGGRLWSTVTSTTTLNAGMYYMYATIPESTHYKAETTEVTNFMVLAQKTIRPTVEDKIYNGQVQTGVYGGNGITLSGQTTGKDVGRYVAQGRLTSNNYSWNIEEDYEEYVWNILPRDVDGIEITLDPTRFTYTGEEQRPTVTVVMVVQDSAGATLRTTLIEGTDYELQFNNNINVGTAEVVISGKGNYSGKAVRNFYIDEVQLSRIELEKASYPYTGGSIVPKETVYGEDGKVLVKDRDYELYYTNNVEIGTGIVGAIGKGNYKGNVEASFQITGNILENVEIELRGFPYVYDGTEKRPEVRVKSNGKELYRGRDFEVTYENNIEASEEAEKANNTEKLPKVKIVGVGTYSGEAEKTFSIMRASRRLNMAPGKAVVVGETGELEYDYTGEVGNTTVELSNEEVVKAGPSKNNTGSYVGSNYPTKGAIEVEGLKEGKSSLTFKVEATNNYNELTKTVQVTVFKKKNSGLDENNGIGGNGINPGGNPSGDTNPGGSVNPGGPDEGPGGPGGETDPGGEGPGGGTGPGGTTPGGPSGDNTGNGDNSRNTYPIYGYVLINDDDEYTNSPKVALTISVDFGDHMYISEENKVPDIDDVNWHEYSPKMPWTFSNKDEGTKTIYVWFKDNYGNMSAMVTDSIILDYDANIATRDNVILDKTNPDVTPPLAKYAEFKEDKVDVEVIVRQEDVIVNDVRSGIDKTRIQYGYRKTNETLPDGKAIGDEEVYTWQNTAIIKDLAYDETYSFVTKVYDRAGNGPVISNERVVQTVSRYKPEIKLKDRNAKYDNRIQEIGEAEVVLINDVKVTGDMEYKYYVEKECKILTTTARDGSVTEGGAPRKPGTYYVIATLKNDAVYLENSSNVAILRIGWDISKGEDDDVFAYLERLNPDKPDEEAEYRLHVSGNGEMADLDELKERNPDESQVYWEEYKDKITELEINDPTNPNDSVTNIGDEMFSELPKLGEIVIPDTVTDIGEDAFKGDSGVDKNVVIPSSVEEIGPGAFAGTNIPEFEVEEGNTNYSDLDGLLTDKEQKRIESYPGGKKDENGDVKKYEIPEGIEEVGESAFEGAPHLEDVVIPDGVEKVEENAFKDCPELKRVEVEDMMYPDNKQDLRKKEKRDENGDIVRDENGNIVYEEDPVGENAFEGLPDGSIIYTFSEDVADEVKKGLPEGSKTEVYWPPVILKQPVDMQGTVGRSVKFIVEVKAGYPQGTNYQWYKTETKDIGRTDEERLRGERINGATQDNYTTETLTATNDKDKYYVRVYNDEYYNERGYLNSDVVEITMLDKSRANYLLERPGYNEYIFERLQEAFDFAEDGDIIRPLQNVTNEVDSKLEGKSITLSTSDKENRTNYTITIDGTITIEKDAALEVAGNGAITKATASTKGNYVIENAGALTVAGSTIQNNGANTTENNGIMTKANSTLTLSGGNIATSGTGVKADNAKVEITGNANITVTTNKEEASGIELTGTTRLNMHAGNIEVRYATIPSKGKLNGIYAKGTGEINITGGTIKARISENVSTTSETVKVNGIENASGSKVTISDSGSIESSGNGIENTSTNKYGDIIITGGKITAGEIGILNDASSAKVILGTKGGEVSRINPVIQAEKVAIVNTTTKDTLEMYDGVLYSHTSNIIYETIDKKEITNTEHIYTEKGRNKIITEKDYSIWVQENASLNGETYNAAYLETQRAPSIKPLEDQAVEEGEKGKFKIEFEDPGHPTEYDFEWEVSTDGGKTWHKVTEGEGGNTDTYTTPFVDRNMNEYKYRCRVSNGDQVTYTNEVTIYVVNRNDENSLRPIIRAVYANNERKVTVNEAGEKVVKMQIIVTTFGKATSIKVNGENLLEEKVIEVTEEEEKELISKAEVRLNGGNIVIRRTSERPVTIGREDETDGTPIISYTYTYNVEIYKENCVLIIEARDNVGRSRIETQPIELFSDLKIEGPYLSTLSSTNRKLTITFYANKPVKPIESAEKASENSNSAYSSYRYRELVPVNNVEYAYKYSYTPNESIDNIVIFKFEDENGNQATVNLNPVARVEYRDAKFSDETLPTDDLTVVDAYELAQGMESSMEVDRNNNIQDRYGISYSQADTFLSRPRDVGALEILNNSTVANSYDGVYIISEITTKISGGHNSIYDSKADRNELVAGGIDSNKNELREESRNYVDIISKSAMELYKGIDLNGFEADEDNPYMYIVGDTIKNTDGEAQKGANIGFRATIISK